MEGLTRKQEEEVYDIAAEVAQEMITKFLINLKSLIPDSSETSEEIQNKHYEEMKSVRSSNNRINENSSDSTVSTQFYEDLKSLKDTQEKTLNISTDFLNQLPLEFNGRVESLDS